MAILLSLLVGAPLTGQEIGSNFNHHPEAIDFEYLGRAGVDWIRVTPYILDYLEGKRQVAGKRGLDPIVEAGERGYKIAFGFRWDFKKRNQRIPSPGSAEERAVFAQARRMLELVGPHVDIFKLGNEPNLETMAADLVEDDQGEVPLVRFVRRQLTEVVEPLYAAHPEWQRPDVYVGSVVWPYDRKQQELPSTLGCLQLVEQSDAITGVSIHLHVSDVSDIEESFRFIRQHVPTKPIIVPEFSLQRLYRARLTEPIGSSPAGQAFAKQYGRDPDWQMYEWLNHAFHHEVSTEEWRDLMHSRPWYPRHYLRQYNRMFTKYGVRLATYPLRFGNPDRLGPTSMTWALNPIYVTWPLIDETGQRVETNPLCFDDFVAVQESGKPLPPHAAKR